MRRQRRSIEVIGMPFLDMISCAFGGVVVLYLITPTTDLRVDTFEVIRIVELRTASGAPFDLGLRFPADSSNKGCFEPDCEREPNVTSEWTRGQGRLTAVLDGDADPPDSLEIAILGGEAFFTTSCIVVRAEIMGVQRIVAINRADGFRRTISRFNDTNAPEETCP